MASPTHQQLRKEIRAELKDADLNSVSAKQVRRALEKRLGVDLETRKKEVDGILMEELNDQQQRSDDGDVTEEPAPRKRSATSSESSEDVDERPRRKKRGVAMEGHSEGSDEDDWKTSKKTVAKKSAEGGTGSGDVKKRGTGYTRQCKLSPALAKLMGEERMARHEVIKKMWEIIKTKNMYDPKNRQYAICDDDMLAVIGVKRFRTFGMMKYLKGHFLSD